VSPGSFLKYRLAPGGYRHPVMLQDAARAVRLVRARAGEWKVDPKRIGIMGSSAGGHLASTLLTHFDAGKSDAADPIDRQSSRPDLGILCYAVITLGEFTHQGSKNICWAKTLAELVRELSNELQVTKDTPPCFIWHTYEDSAVPVENSMQFAEALRKAGVPYDLHIYQTRSTWAWPRHPRLEPREEASVDARLHRLVAGAGVCEVSGVVE